MQKAALERVTFDGSGDFLRAVRARVQTRLDGQAPSGGGRLHVKAAITVL